MNAIIGTLRYFGLPVTKENYSRLASIGTATELHPESEAEMEAALEAEEYMAAYWRRSRSKREDSDFSEADCIRAHGMGITFGG